MNKLSAWVVAAVMLMACETDTKYNTQYPCNFVFFTNIYPTSALTRAVNNPGEFCIVEPETVQGVVHLKLRPNHGTWAAADLDLTMRTAINNERLSYGSMGAGRGLIIGRSNFFGLKAYDLQCPNCLDELGAPRAPLDWADDGRYLECARCHRVYNQDNDDGTIVSNGKKGDHLLIQYRSVNYNATDGRLYVHN
ncbi:MAG: hypothetical protein IJV45_11580 [Prevotella sp.]|nr:hypothetical protein [Prevotella sp.]